MTKDQTIARAEALSFLKTHNAGVIATAGDEGQPHASAVYYAADDSFNIFFFTKVDSRKFASIKKHPQVAFTIGRLDVPQTLQIEGVASQIPEGDEKTSHIEELFETLKKTNPLYLPLAKMDSSVGIMWIQPKWIRWADFSTPGLGNENMFTEITIG